MALPKMDTKPHAPTLVYAVVVVILVVFAYHVFFKARRR